MVLKPLKKKLVSWLGPWLAFWAINVLGRTMRFEIIHPEISGNFWEKGIPAIGVCWHGRLLMMPLAYEGKKLSFLVSPHRDGQIVGKAQVKSVDKPDLEACPSPGAPVYYLWGQVDRAP